jgi:hypothetical protein
MNHGILQVVMDIMHSEFTKGTVTSEILYAGQYPAKYFDIGQCPVKYI